MSKSVIFSIIVALLIVIGAYFLKFGDTNLQMLEGDYKRSELEIGSLGEEHSHMSILIFIEDKLLSLDGEIYAEKADAAHFHDNDGTVIHKHTKGVTLPFFLETLGIKITPSCLTLDTEEVFCSESESNKTLSVYINRKKINEHLGSQELRDGDKILINYGSDNEVQTTLKLNSVPDLPKDLDKSPQ